MLNGTTIQVATLGPCLANFERTPSDVIQVNWRPSATDLDFDSPGTATLDVTNGAGVAFAWEGLAANTGIMFRCTVVWEWLPKVAGGLISQSTDKNASSM